MNPTTKEKATGPLGVIDCLAAGFETLGRNLWLIVLPLLLDLFLWMGPRLKITPLLQAVAAFLVAQPVPDPETARQVAQAAELLELFGEQFNLLSLLGALPLLDVPSLLAHRAPGAVLPLGEPRELLVTSALALMAWVAVLIPIGLALGFLYLNSLAGRVLVMRSSEADQAVEASSGMGKAVRVLVFVAGLLMIGMVVGPLWMLLVGTATAIAQSLGFLAWAFGVGLMGYVALHLLFVVHGILLGGQGLLRAIWDSILLIHTQFPSVLGLVVLVVLIYEGLGYVWSLPSGDSWLLLVGILGNGCIVTGLTVATFVFYQERVAVSRQQVADRRQPSHES